MTARLWQIDFIRGVAILLMVFYHLIWDMHYFGLFLAADVTVGAWHVFARSIAALFLLLVGVSFVLAAERRPPAVRDRQWMVRGAKLYGWALAITAVTWTFLGDEFVRFGILHLIATALVLAPWLWRGRALMPWLGTFVVGLGIWFTERSITFGGDWLTPVGLGPRSYNGVDYYPILPWLGFVMLGLAIGPWLVKRLPRPSQPADPVPPPAAARPLVWAGRRSLVIYITHQPLLLAGFWLFGYTMW